MSSGISEVVEVDAELVFRTMVTVKRSEAERAYPELDSDDACIAWAREFSEAAPLDTWDKDTFDLVLA